MRYVDDIIREVRTDPRLSPTMKQVIINRLNRLEGAPTPEEIKEAQQEVYGGDKVNGGS